MRARISPRPEWLDLALALGGVLFGSASLAYPLTLDAGVNYYVAREWLLRGALPYRDVFDHRAPAIYVLHAACIAVFGEHPWGIRVAELLGIVAAGWLAARTVTARGRRPTPGTCGLAVLAGAVFYYGFFDYWGTAQCELWCAIALLAGLVAAGRARTVVGAAVWSGFACGAAFAFKPAAAPLLLVVAARLGCRLREDAVRGRPLAGACATFAGASLAVPAAFVAYFAIRGGLADFADVLFGANAYYVAHEPAQLSARSAAHQLWIAWHFFAPFDTLVLATLAIGGLWALLTRGVTRFRWVLLAATFAGVVVSVVLQRKFFLYHWAIAVAPVMILAVMASRPLFARVARAPMASSWACAGVLAGVIGLAYWRTGGPFDVWARTTRATVAWVSGRDDRSSLMNAYSVIDRFYAYRVHVGDRERVGQWLGAHTSANDKILVRGMAAEIYAVSGRRAPGRFFWSLFLSLPTRAYHRDQWLEEDRQVLELDPPRYVVVYASIAQGPDSESWFAPFGYVERWRMGDLVVMERA